MTRSERIIALVERLAVASNAAQLRAMVPHVRRKLAEELAAVDRLVELDPALVADLDKRAARHNLDRNEYLRWVLTGSPVASDG